MHIAEHEQLQFFGVSQRVLPPLWGQHKSGYAVVGEGVELVCDGVVLPSGFRRVAEPYFPSYDAERGGSDE